MEIEFLRNEVIDHINNLREWTKPVKVSHPASVLACLRMSDRVGPSYKKSITITLNFSVQLQLHF